jgi:hypothetical protein
MIACCGCFTVIVGAFESSRIGFGSRIVRCARSMWTTGR